jgi:hypothetical protein
VWKNKRGQVGIVFLIVLGIIGIVFIGYGVLSEITLHSTTIIEHQISDLSLVMDKIKAELYRDLQFSSKEGIDFVFEHGGFDSEIIDDPTVFSKIRFYHRPPKRFVYWLTYDDLTFNLVENSEKRHLLGEGYISYPTIEEFQRNLAREIKKSLLGRISAYRSLVSGEILFNTTDYHVKVILGDETTWVSVETYITLKKRDIKVTDFVILHHKIPIKAKSIYLAAIKFAENYNYCAKGYERNKKTLELVSESCIESEIISEIINRNGGAAFVYSPTEVPLKYFTTKKRLKNAFLNQIYTAKNSFVHKINKETQKDGFQIDIETILKESFVHCKICAGRIDQKFGAIPCSNIADSQQIYPRNGQLYVRYATDIPILIRIYQTHLPEYKFTFGAHLFWIGHDTNFRDVCEDARKKCYLDLKEQLHFYIRDFCEYSERLDKKMGFCIDKFTIGLRVHPAKENLEKNIICTP